MSTPSLHRESTDSLMIITVLLDTGLDAASSTEILTALNALAASNRTVVLTIHQPRLEIFHMFHRVIVLSEGEVKVLTGVCLLLHNL